MLRTHSFRLKPGDDLRVSIEDFVVKNNVQAAVVLGCVGSLTRVVFRFAGKAEATVLEGKFEIVSLEATLSAAGCHLHMAVADEEGRTTGGHFLPGCLVFTTAEVVIGEIDDTSFDRQTDPQTGYRELVIRRG